MLESQQKPCSILHFRQILLLYPTNTVMELLNPALNRYAEAHTTAESEVLRNLSRETHLKVLMPQMLSGHLQGAFLQLLSHAIRPRRVLEIGTFTGYSAICLSAGLTDDGQLHTIDINEELADMQDRYFAEAGLTKKIVRHIGDARNIVPTLNETFDLVFIDADKVNYLHYYELVFDKVRTGGFIVADNVLWSGKVVEDLPDASTRALMEYTATVAANSRVETVLLPLRDGLLVARKVV